MNLCGMAQYNFLIKKYNKTKKLSNVEPWQIINYRDFSLKQLFTGLNELISELNCDNFKDYASKFESPESFAHNLSEVAPENKEKIYLYIFELWRRLVDKKTISIFCDELDHIIDDYNENKNTNEKIIYSTLSDLIDILNYNVDIGENQNKMFACIKRHLSNKLESFICHFLHDQLNNGNKESASELLHDFSDYIENNIWFDFLKIKKIETFASKSSVALMSSFLKNLHEKPNLDIYFDLLSHLITIGDYNLFADVCMESLKLIKNKEQFTKLLNIILDYYIINDMEKKEALMKDLIKEMEPTINNKKIKPSDKEKICNILV